MRLGLPSTLNRAFRNDLQTGFTFKCGRTAFWKPNFFKTDDVMMILVSWIPSLKARLHVRLLSQQLDAIFVALKLHQVSNVFETPAISRRQIALKSHLVYTCDFEVKCDKNCIELPRQKHKSVRNDRHFLRVYFSSFNIVWSESIRWAFRVKLDAVFKFFCLSCVPLSKRPKRQLRRKNRIYFSNSIRSKKQKNRVGTWSYKCPKQTGNQRK